MSRISVALRDFGYSFEGRTLFRNRPAYTPKEIVGRFPDERAAAEYLIPIIHDEEFTARVTAEREPVGLDAKLERIRMAIENFERFKGFELNMIMRHLKLALLSNTGQFLVKRIVSYSTQRVGKGLELQASLIITTGPNFFSEREARFTFTYDGHRFKGQITQEKKRAQNKGKGKVNINELFN